MTAVDERAISLADAVHACPNGIVDPCSVTAGAPAGLVDMGLVRHVSLDGAGAGKCRAVIKIAITHPFCMMAGVFLHEVRKRVGAIDGIGEVDVSLDLVTLWTPELMTEDYRARLARVREAKRIEA